MTVAVSLPNPTVWRFGRPAGLIAPVLPLGFLLAWIGARTDTPARGALEILITLPFFIPPILTATAWAMLGNAQVGTINLAWRWLTGSARPPVQVFSYRRVVRL